MKKALIVATVGGFIASFEINNVKILKSLGYEVHCAANFKEINEDKNKELMDIGIIIHQIDFSRSPFSKQTIIAYLQIKQLTQYEDFDLIHCHTPVGGVITRFVIRKYRSHGTKVLYTAHGFHFYKGASILNWLIYFPIEWICAHWTDILITINKEDFALAKKMMKADKVVYIPGIGIDLNKFGKQRLNCKHVRKELQIPDKAKLLFSVGELNENKNHLIVIKALAEIPEVKSGNIFYVIAGQGNLNKKLQAVIRNLEVENQVKLLGFRNDIVDLYNAADIFIFPSFREGLSVALMEAMASGLPIACSKIRGNTDLIDENGGVLFNPCSIEACRNAILKLLKSDMRILGNNNKEKIKKYGIEIVNERMNKIFRGIRGSIS